MAILQSFEVPSHSTAPNAVSKVLRFDLALCLRRKGQCLLNGPAVVLGFPDTGRNEMHEQNNIQVAPHLKSDSPFSR
jgi:hypothetical protein